MCSQYKRKQFSTTVSCSVLPSAGNLFSTVVIPTDHSMCPVETDGGKVARAVSEQRHYELLGPSWPVKMTTNYLLPLHIISFAKLPVSILPRMHPTSRKTPHKYRNIPILLFVTFGPENQVSQIPTKSLSSETSSLLQTNSS